MNDYPAKQERAFKKAESSQHTNYKSIQIQEGDMNRIEGQGGVRSMRDVKLIQAVESQDKYDKGSKGKGKMKSDRCYIKAGGNYETVMFDINSATHFGKFLEEKGIKIPRQAGDSDLYRKEYLAEFIDEMYYEVFQEFMKGYYNDRCFETGISASTQYKYDFNKVAILNDVEAVKRIQARMEDNIQVRGIGASAKRVNAIQQEKAKFEEEKKGIQEAHEREMAEMRKQMEVMKAMMKAQAGKSKLSVKPKKSKASAPKVSAPPDDIEIEIEE